MGAKIPGERVPGLFYFVIFNNSANTINGNRIIAIMIMFSPPYHINRSIIYAIAAPTVNRIENTPI
jgi:hypothetical protein